MTVVKDASGGFTATGLFTLGDYNTIVSNYNQMTGTRIPLLSKGHILTANDLNNIRNLVGSKAADYVIPPLPGPFSWHQIWPKMYWPGTPYKYRVWTYTQGYYQFFVPPGVSHITVIGMVGGGGGGGMGINWEYGGAGGAGGSGGWYTNYTINVVPGQSFEIWVGGGGTGTKWTPGSAGWQATSWRQWPGPGGDTYIHINGRQVLFAGGGRNGTDAQQWGGGAGGAGGSPNGNNGGAGGNGWSHKSRHVYIDGPTGAASPWGAGGRGGITSGWNGSPTLNAGDATGYGSGGGGGATCDTTGWYSTWMGGNGAPGWCQISLSG